MGAAVVLMPNEVDQFADRVAAMVIKKVTELRSIEEPLTKQGAAKYLKVSLTTFNRRLSDGGIPSKYIHRNGGTLYFFASELETLLKKNQ